MLARYIESMMAGRSALHRIPKIALLAAILVGQTGPGAASDTPPSSVALRFSGFSSFNNVTTRIDLKFIEHPCSIGLPKGTFRCREICRTCGNACPGTKGRLMVTAQIGRNPIDDRGCNSLIDWVVSFEDGSSCDFTGSVPWFQKGVVAMNGTVVCRDASGAPTTERGPFGVVGLHGRPQIVPRCGSGDGGPGFD
jgi:hypothetical protein